MFKIRLLRLLSNLSGIPLLSLLHNMYYENRTQGAQKENTQKQEKNTRINSKKGATNQ